MKTTHELLVDSQRLSEELYELTFDLRVMNQGREASPQMQIRQAEIVLAKSNDLIYTMLHVKHQLFLQQCNVQAVKA